MIPNRMPISTDHRSGDGDQHAAPDRHALRVKDRFIGVMEVINKRRGPSRPPMCGCSINWRRPRLPRSIMRGCTRAKPSSTEEVRRHNLELSALHAISAALSQSLEIQHVLDAALMVLQPQFNYEGGCICLNDSQHNASAYAYHAPADGISLSVDSSVTHALSIMRFSDEQSRPCRIPANSIARRQPPGTR